MNLHGIVSPYIGAVNPSQPAWFEASNGFTQADDLSQEPAFLPSVMVSAQVQELTSKDLQKLEGLNLQANAVGIYLYGISNGVVRIQQKGGDRITIPTGAAAGVYAVDKVIEQWPDWVKVVATLQNLEIDPTKTPSLDFSDPDNSQNLPGGLPA
jgi:hypothetical protein